MKKIAAWALIVPVMVAGLSGCGGDAGSDGADGAVELVLAHNLSDTHVTSEALVSFAEKVEEASDGRITPKIFPNGQLGSETEVIEQLMVGLVDMTRVSAPGLATYTEGYNAFGLPYIFEDADHYYASMDSEDMREFFNSSQDAGFVGLTYYTSGARSFYTATTPIREPGNLRGMKIRVQNMRSQTDMVTALGGTPVVIPFGEIYTSLQTGVIDGAESNETALTQAKHGEVAKVFSLDEHTMIPDMLVISTKTWERLPQSDRDILVEAAIASTEEHKVTWKKAIESAVEEAEGMGVTFVEDVDKKAFQEAAASMVGDYADEYPGVQDVLNIVDSER